MAHERLEGHYASPDITERLLSALRRVQGDNVPVTVETLAPLDHLHRGGLTATRKIAPGRAAHAHAVIVLVESHRQERATLRPGIAPPEAGARWGKPAQFGFDASDAEVEEERGGVVQIQRSSSPERVMVWNLSPVWRRCDVVKIVSQDDPNLTTEALVTREMLIPVGSKTQRYVGGGIGYVVERAPRQLAVRRGQGPIR